MTKRRKSQSNKGVILLAVVSLLTLFVLIGTTYVVVSNNYRHAAVVNAEQASTNSRTQLGDGWTSRHKSRNLSANVQRNGTPNLASFSRVIHQDDNGKTEVSRPRAVNQPQPVILQASNHSTTSSRVTSVAPASTSQQSGSKLKWVSPR